MEYRAVSGVFRTIDPPPPLLPASVSSPPPPPKAGGFTLAGRGGGGVNILEDATHWIGLSQYNPSTAGCHDNRGKRLRENAALHLIIHLVRGW
jgi:hypothetical protein